MIWRNALEGGSFSLILAIVDTLATYRRNAMKFAVVTDLGADEGFVARIPGFRGLLATGRTKKEALAELNDALTDWIDLALKRGIGLPALREKRAAALTAA
jgi:predicted RNase H-like HicB family nuclease